MAPGSDIDFGLTVIGFTSGRRVFNRFTLTRQLGRGGMGLVWLAHDEKLERDVALKFLPETVALDPRSVDDLKHETRRSLELTHPHIVRIYDFFEDANTAGIAMEFVDGATLAKLAVEQPLRCFEPAQILPWLRQLADALDYAHHKAKIVHRDLKPANLMVTRAGDLKIADFGISATVTDSVTRVSRVMSSGATPAYASPQQIMGERASPSDDIYSLGATLYDLITGKPPFHTGNLLAQVQEKAPPPMRQRRAEHGIAGAPVPDVWEATVAACLAKEAAGRPPSAGAVLAALEGGRLELAGAAAEPAPAPKAVNPATVAVATTAAAPAAPAAAKNAPAPPRGGGVFGWWFGRLTGAGGPAAQAWAVVIPLVGTLALAAAVFFGLRRTAPPTQVVDLDQAVRPAGPPQVDAGRTDARADVPPSRDTSTVVETRPQKPAPSEQVTWEPATKPVPKPPPEEEKPAPRKPPPREESPVVQPEPTTTPAEEKKVIQPPPKTAPSEEKPVMPPPGPTPIAPVPQPTVVAPAPVLPQPGTISISTTPPGATVVAAGREIGRTPLIVQRVPPGMVYLGLRLQDYRDVDLTTAVRAGETSQVEVTLERSPVSSEPHSFTVPDLDLTMIWIAPGEFVMGSSPAESGRGSDEQPQTGVRFSRGFWIGRTEVTQAQYQAVSGSNPSAHRSTGPNAPVERVSWAEAARFCQKLTERERAAGRLPQGYLYALPSEAQWEYACRAGTTGAYAGTVETLAWVARKSVTPMPVGQKQPNGWGLFDMHGNVAEWTASGYARYPGGVQTDFAPPSSGSTHTFRGGSYDSALRGARSAYRNWVSGDNRDGNRGFRVALVPEQARFFGP